MTDEMAGRRNGPAVAQQPQFLFTFTLKRPIVSPCPCRHSFKAPTEGLSLPRAYTWWGYTRCRSGLRCGWGCCLPPRPRSRTGAT
jgi:hypothetical protein